MALRFKFLFKEFCDSLKLRTRRTSGFALRATQNPLSFHLPLKWGFFYSNFTHKKCPIMFIMLHSSSITLYYHYFNLCSIHKILLFFIFFISFHPIISMLFTPLQHNEHFVAFKINRTLKTMIFYQYQQYF